MDVRRREITPAGSEESASFNPPFLAGSDYAPADEMAARRPQALPARAICDAGIVRFWPPLAAQSWCFKKELDFRIYFAIIKSALAVYPQPSKTKSQR